MQKQLKGLMRKILIIFSLVCVLGLTFSVYADDLEESNDSSGDSAVPIDLEEDFRRTAENIYLVLSDNGTRATPHDVNDVYNLIVQIFYNQSNGSNEIVVIRQKLASIDTYCYTIMNNVTSINTTLSNFYNSINPDYDQTGISIYDLIHTFYDSIFDIDGTDGDISLMELLLVIEDEIENVELQINSIISSVASIDSKCSTISSTLNTLNTNLINVYSAITSQSSLLHGDLDTINSNVNANMALIINRLQSIQNDFNNISWGSNYTIDGIYNSLENLYSNTPISSSVSSSIFYYKINLYNKISSPSLIRLVSSVTSSSNGINYKPSVSLYYMNGNSLVAIPSSIYYFDANYSCYIYFDDLYSYLSSGSYLVIQYSFPTNSYFTITSNLHYFNILNSSNLDYYTVYNFLLNYHNNTIMKKFEGLYASDDLIQAKQNQQDYEDDAINDFTGSGSAAASRGDLSNIKDVSTTIKQGLQTGGSVSNALSVFNSSGSFWGWFATQNYNDINNLSSTPNNRSGSTSEPEVIDFYTNNQYTLQGLLNGGN